jgi:hypothetical protein
VLVEHLHFVAGRPLTTSVPTILQAEGCPSLWQSDPFVIGGEYVNTSFQPMFMYCPESGKIRQPFFWLKIDT